MWDRNISRAIASERDDIAHAAAVISAGNWGTSPADGDSLQMAAHDLGYIALYLPITIGKAAQIPTEGDAPTPRQIAKLISDLRHYQSRIINALALLGELHTEEEAN